MTSSEIYWSSGEAFASTVCSVDSDVLNMVDTEYSVIDEFIKLNEFSAREYKFIGGVDGYYKFLRKHLLECKPTFYSVVKKKVISVSSNRRMVVLQINNSVDNPELDIIAECYINGEFIYLWNDFCWLVAINSSGSFATKSIDVGISVSKILTIFPIGRSWRNQQP